MPKSLHFAICMFYITDICDIFNQHWVNSLPNKLQAAHACTVNLLGPHDECLLVKVRLWLFTLDGGIESFQIPLCVWHCVVCLGRDRQSVSWNWTKSGDRVIFLLSFHTTVQKKYLCAVTVLGRQSGTSYFMIGLSIQACCGNKTCAVISARLQQY